MPLVKLPIFYTFNYTSNFMIKIITYSIIVKVLLRVRTPSLRVLSYRVNYIFNRIQLRSKEKHLERINRANKNCKNFELKTTWFRPHFSHRSVILKFSTFIIITIINSANSKLSASCCVNFLFPISPNFFIIPLPFQFLKPRSRSEWINEWIWSV